MTEAYSMHTECRLIGMGSFHLYYILPRLGVTKFISLCLTASGLGICFKHLSPFKSSVAWT